jgi:hypothetical protein
MTSMKPKKNNKTEQNRTNEPGLEKVPQSMLHLHRYAGLKREEITALKNTENRRKQKNEGEYIG